MSVSVSEFESESASESVSLSPSLPVSGFSSDADDLSEQAREKINSVDSKMKNKS